MSDLNQPHPTGLARGLAKSTLTAAAIAAAMALASTATAKMTVKHALETAPERLVVTGTATPTNGGPINPVIPTIRKEDPVLDTTGDDGTKDPQPNPWNPTGRPTPGTNTTVGTTPATGGAMNPVVPTIRVKDIDDDGNGKGDEADPNGRPGIGSVPSVGTTPTTGGAMNPVVPTIRVKDIDDGAGKGDEADPNGRPAPGSNTTIGSTPATGGAANPVIPTIRVKPEVPDPNDDGGKD